MSELEATREQLEQELFTVKQNIDKLQATHLKVMRVMDTLISHVIVCACVCLCMGACVCVCVCVCVRVCVCVCIVCMCVFT